jgi:hypothetical protein
MGLRRGSRQYFQAVRSLLELYGKDVGVRYDKDEEMINQQEAAQLCGLDQQSYQRAVREMAAQGRFSWQKK